MLEQVKKWMKEHRYHSIQSFIGKLGYDYIKNPVIYERFQLYEIFCRLKGANIIIIPISLIFKSP